MRLAIVTIRPVWLTRHTFGELWIEIKAFEFPERPFRHDKMMIFKEIRACLCVKVSGGDREEARE
jgi:hypothetical protein